MLDLMAMSTMTKTYSKMLQYKSFEDRLKYLRLDGRVGEQTFAGKRTLNQILYKSSVWLNLRKKIIIRDYGFDLAHKDFVIFGKILIHHINPITVEDVLEQNQIVFDLENLVSTSFDTHNTIHYGTNIAEKGYTERKPGDTTLW